LFRVRLIKLCSPPLQLKSISGESRVQINVNYDGKTAKKSLFFVTDEVTLSPGNFTSVEAKSFPILFSLHEEHRVNSNRRSMPLVSCQRRNFCQGCGTVCTVNVNRTGFE
jgi:hypothetical protein